MRISETKPTLQTIHASQAGQRIDNFLFTLLKTVPKSRVYRILRKGEVRINKKRIKPEYRLQADDILRIPPIKLMTDKVRKPDPRFVERIEQTIIFEDEHLIVLNKAAGIAVHAGSGIEFGVIEALRASPKREGFLELGHRLDRETSGCLLLAKDRETLMEIHSLLREGEGGIAKCYLALVAGVWEGEERLIDLPLHKLEQATGDRMVKVSEEGLASRTMFAPVQRFADYTLLQAEPLTGRTHQIRVHAAHIGHPIAGDDKYGSRDVNKKILIDGGLNRLFLHAYSLSFSLPGYPKPLSFKAELDDKLQLVLEKLL